MIFFLSQVYSFSHAQENAPKLNNLSENKYQGKYIVLQLGYSHDIYFEPPEGITITANKTEIKINGINKQLVGEVAAKIRSFRKPEPYKGKGIRYKNEYVISKQGKTVGGSGS